MRAVDEVQGLQESQSWLQPLPGGTAFLGQQSSFGSLAQCLQQFPCFRRADLLQHHDGPLYSQSFRRRRREIVQKSLHTLLHLG